MRKIIFTGLAVSAFCLSETEIRDLFNANSHSQLVLQYEKNKNADYTSSGLNMIARSYFQLKQLDNATYTCARSLSLEPSQRCSVLMQKVKETNEELYHRELGKFYFETRDYSSAFSKFFHLVSTNPKDSKSRAYLVEVFRINNRLDSLQEQLWILKEEKSVIPHIQWLNFQTKTLQEQVRKNKNFDPLENQDLAYFLILTTQDPGNSHFTLLKNHYEKMRNDKIINEIDLIRYANLCLLDSEFKKAEDLGDQAENLMTKAETWLSLESLRLRLPTKEERQKLKEEEKIASEQESGIKKPVVKAPVIINPALAPWDFSDFSEASMSNFKPYEKMKEEYHKRLSLAKDEYQKRQVFDILRTKLSEYDSSHITAENHPLEKWFQNMPDGQKFSKEVEEMALKLHKEDQQNAKKFIGTYTATYKTLQSATTETQKREALRDFHRQWTYIQMNPFTDVRLRDAWIEYLYTEEGKALVSLVDSESKKLGPHPLNKRFGTPQNGTTFRRFGN